jgi:hypothetical protein
VVRQSPWWSLKKTCICSRMQAAYSRSCERPHRHRARAQFRRLRSRKRLYVKVAGSHLKARRYQRKSGSPLSFRSKVPLTREFRRRETLDDGASKGASNADLWRHPFLTANHRRNPQSAFLKACSSEPAKRLRTKGRFFHKGAFQNLYLRKHPRLPQLR